MKNKNAILAVSNLCLHHNPFHSCKVIGPCGHGDTVTTQFIYNRIMMIYNKMAFGRHLVCFTNDSCCSPLKELQLG